MDNPDDLVTEIKERLEEMPEGDKMIYLKADQELAYSEVMKVMDLVREAGVEEIALIAEPQSAGRLSAMATEKPNGCTPSPHGHKKTLGRPLARRHPARAHRRRCPTSTSRRSST